MSHKTVTLVTGCPGQIQDDPLTNEKGEREFSPEHAQGILALQEKEHVPDHHRWTLPASSPFEFVGSELRLKKENGTRKSNGNTGKAAQ